jgi:hypothetical protein
MLLPTQVCPLKFYSRWVNVSFSSSTNYQTRIFPANMGVHTQFKTLISVVWTMDGSPVCCVSPNILGFPHYFSSSLSVMVPQFSSDITIPIVVVILKADGRIIQSRYVRLHATHGAWSPPSVRQSLHFRSNTTPSLGYYVDLQARPSTRCVHQHSFSSLF